MFQASRDLEGARAAHRKVPKQAKDDGGVAKPTPPEPTGAEVVGLKLSNASLPRENEKMKKDNVVLQAQYSTILSKFEEDEACAATLQDDNKKLYDEVAGLKHTITNLSSKIATLIERMPHNECSKNDNGQSQDGSVPATEVSMKGGSERTENSTNYGDTTDVDAPRSEDAEQPGNPEPSTNKNPTTEDKKTTKWSWATGVRPGRKVLTKELQSHMTESVNLLTSSDFHPRRVRQRPDAAIKPTPVAVYFGDIPRCPIGALKKALMKCLPKLAILGISFITASVTDILCLSAHKDRVIATLQFFATSISQG